MRQQAQTAHAMHVAVELVVDQVAGRGAAGLELDGEHRWRKTSLRVEPLLLADDAAARPVEVGVARVPLLGEVAPLVAERREVLADSQVAGPAERDAARWTTRAIDAAVEVLEPRLRLHVGKLVDEQVVDVEAFRALRCIEAEHVDHCPRHRLDLPLGPTHGRDELRRDHAHDVPPVEALGLRLRSRADDDVLLLQRPPRRERRDHDLLPSRSRLPSATARLRSPVAGRRVEHGTLLRMVVERHPRPPELCCRIACALLGLRRRVRRNRRAHQVDEPLEIRVVRRLRSQGARLLLQFPDVTEQLHRALRRSCGARRARGASPACRRRRAPRSGSP